MNLRRSANLTAAADPDPSTDHRVWSDHHIVADLRIGIDNRRRMNLRAHRSERSSDGLPAYRSTIAEEIVASAATFPSTSTRPFSFPWAVLIRRTSTS